MKRPIVPVINLEIAKDPEASERTRTTPVDSISFRGVTLTSRWSKAFENEEMLNMLEGVSEQLVGLIDTFFCDSKACATYSVIMRHGTKAQTAAVAQQLKDACLAHSQGFNSIDVKSSSGETYLGADWTKADFADHK